MNILLSENIHNLVECYHQEKQNSSHFIRDMYLGEVKQKYPLIYVRLTRKPAGGIYPSLVKINLVFFFTA